MQTNAEKCREMQKNAEKCKECREMQTNAEKYREITFMTIMTLNVIFDILEPHAFRKFSTCWVLQKFEEPCRILKKLVPACVVNVIHVNALSASVLC